jgi:hypothetical protein
MSEVQATALPIEAIASDAATNEHKSLVTFTRNPFYQI